MKHIFLSIKNWLSSPTRSGIQNSHPGLSRIGFWMRSLRSLTRMTPFVILSRKAKNPGTIAIIGLALFLAFLGTFIFRNQLTTFFAGSAGADPVAYWKFDEGQGSTAYDTVGSNNGTLGSGSSAPTWISDDQCISGKCLRFDGTNDTVSLTPFNSITNQITVEAWVRPSNVTGINTVISNWDSPSSNAFILFSDYTSSKPRFRVGPSGSDNNVDATTSLIANQWYYLAGVYDGSTVKIYVNGMQEGSVAASGNLLTTNDDADIGSYGGGNFYKGTIDGVKIYNYARTAAQIKADFAARGTTRGVAARFGDDDLSRKLSSGLVGYWKMDEATGSTGPSWTALDSSGNGNNGTGAGNAGTTAPGKFGNGGSFDGTGDYVQVTNSSTLQLGSNLTIAAWVKPTSISDSMVVSKEQDASGANSEYQLAIISSKWRGGCSQTTFKSVSSVDNAEVGVWSHINMVNDGSNLLLYVNGKLNNSTSTVACSSGSTSGNVNIGKRSFDSNFFLNGLIDQVRIYNRALDPSEVKALYQWAPGPVAHWKMDDGVSGDSQTIKDISGNGNNGTTSDGANNTGMNCTVQGKFGKGCNFDGSDDYVNSSYDSNFSTNSFSISGWVKSSSSSEQELISTVAEKGANDPFISLRLTATGTAIFEVRGDDGQSTISAPSTSTYNNGQWHYVTGIKNATSNIKLYVDGVLVATSGSGISGSVNISSYPLYIGVRNERGGAPSQYFNGLIDDVRIYNYARTPEQIVSDMNAGHPAVGTPVGSTVLHLKMDEGYGTTTQDWSPQGNDGTLGAGNSAPTWTNDGKFGKALSFDGTNDYVSVGSMQFTADLSISTWIKTSTSAQRPVVSNRSGPGVTYYGVTGGKAFVYYNSATPPSVVSNTSINDNAWHQFIYVHSGDTTYFYIDGKLDQTAIQTGYSSITNTVQIGYDIANGEFFPGLIDEVKVYPFALTADQVKVDYAGGKTQVLGSKSTGVGGTAPDNSSSRSYCVPGDASTCNAPVGEWKFNEGVGGTANDTSGNGNMGNFGAGTSAPTWVNGKVGKALKFDGNDYLDAGNNSILNFSDGNFSLEAWVKPTDITVYGGIISKGSGCSSNEEYLFNSHGSTTPGTLSLYYKGGWRTSTTAPLIANTWQHVAAIVSGGNTITYYVNGSQAGSSITGITGTDGPTLTYDLFIGTQGSCHANPFRGLIDQVRIYNYARTPAQIAWEYNRGAPVAYYKFNECTGTTANDWGPNANGGTNGNNGTITIGATGSQTTAGTCTTSGAWFNGATGKREASLNFDGSDDYVDAGTNPITTETMSASFWIKSNTSNWDDYGTPVGTGDRLSPSWNFYTSLSGKAVNFGSQQKYVSATPTDIQQWHHFAGVIDGASVKIYMDGALTNSRNDGAAITPNTNPLWIGRDSNFTTRYVNGQIDDVKIFNYALTPQQVKTEMAGGAVRFE